MTPTLVDLRGLRGRRWYVVAVLVGLALVVLACRAVGLVVFVAVDLVERAEVLACSAAGIGPVAGGALVAPAPVPGGWTPPGGDW